MKMTRKPLPCCAELVGVNCKAENRQPVSVIQPVKPSVKRRVGAYARVSKGTEQQKSSIDIQRKHFASLAAEHDDWEFAGVYFDIISGTKKETRPALNRMLKDCAEGRINLVLTKSISRFARNTTDLLEMVRKLAATGTDIYFERENLDTRIMGTEFLLTILASLAEDESHSISANCRWGIQKRFSDGTYRVSTAPYGYDVSDGTYVVNTSEAEVVREIFARTADGAHMKEIADDLNARGVPTKHTGQLRLGEVVQREWTIRSIRALLRNVAYIGDMILQKVYTDSTFKKRRNNGVYPKYYVEGHHEAIVDRAVFDRVQGILDAHRTGNTGAKKSYLFSGKLSCQVCGSPLYRDVKSGGRVCWVCREHRKRAANCPMGAVSEERIWAAFKTVVNRMRADDNIITKYMAELEKTYRENHRETLEALEGRLCALDSQLTINATRNQINQSYSERTARQNELQMERMEIKTLLERMTDSRIREAQELLSVIQEQGRAPTDRTACKGITKGEYDRFEAPLSYLFDTYVKKIMVCGGERFVFHFRCGLIVV